MACSSGDGVEHQGEPKKLFPCESVRNISCFNSRLLYFCVQENSSRGSSPDLDALLDVDELLWVQCGCKSHRCYPSLVNYASPA